jgi:hypothetical protein
VEEEGIVTLQTSPVRRFLDDVVTPLSALAMLHPYTRAGAMAYQGVRTAIAMAPRMRTAATIIGAGAVAGYDKIRTFFSEKAGGGKDSRDKDSSKSRIQNSPQDIKEFLADKIQKGICEKWKPIKGKQTYRFTRKEGKFKKDDWFSHDTLHHELEWFNSKGTHKGAVEPKGGAKYKPADPRKNVKMD